MKESQRGRFPGKLLHGGDYNPDQWLERPEGEYSFGWLRERIDRLSERISGNRGEA